MYDTGAEVNWIIVFEATLLAPKLLQLVQTLLEEDRLTFVATPAMLRVLREVDKHRAMTLIVVDG